MSYQERTTEWAPHPEKAEHIFLSVVVREYLSRKAAFVETEGEFLSPESVGPELERLIPGVIQAWSAYRNLRRRQGVLGLENRMSLARSEAELKEFGEEAKTTPLTASEREAVKAIYLKRLQELRNGQIDQ